MPRWLEWQQLRGRLCAGLPNKNSFSSVSLSNMDYKTSGEEQPLKRRAIAQNPPLSTRDTCGGAVLYWRRNNQRRWQLYLQFDTSSTVIYWFDFIPYNVLLYLCHRPNRFFMPVGVKVVWLW